MPSQVVVYVNADIILFDGFPEAHRVTAARFSTFLMVGRRSEWASSYLTTNGTLTELARAVAQESVMQDGCMIDYFAFRGHRC